MGLIWIAAAGILAALLLWWAFPTVARIAGFLIVLDSLGSIVFFPHQALPSRLWWLAGGFVLWLAGQWAFAAKHGCWASRIAVRIFGLPGLRRLIPRSTLITPGRPGI